MLRRGCFGSVATLKEGLSPLFSDGKGGPPL